MADDARSDVVQFLGIYKDPGESRLDSFPQR